MSKKIAITTGDVNGIGAEITIKALDRLGLPREDVVLISNSDVLGFYGNLAPHLNPRPLWEREVFQHEERVLEKRVRGDYKIIEIPFDKKSVLPGKITAESGEFSFQCLKKACEMAKNGEIDAIVTAPVSKESLHLAGHKFNGQTEVLQSYLAKEGQHAEMLFVAGDFRVLLLTRHVALKDISLNKEEVIKKIVDLDEFFKTEFAIKEPNFALCALNPHAGEAGILGREEIEILQPAVNELRKKGINITNPLPADTLFIQAAKAYLQTENSLHASRFTLHPYDCYIACYHDQGLIPIKTVASEKTVNMTIGLNVIRTSPCHGTAFDIAGKNLASEESMIEAILQAIKI
jgi:4-hydroxythreonine-4-phosphate dehydrogenase